MEECFGFLGAAVNRLNFLTFKSFFEGHFHKSHHKIDHLVICSFFFKHALLVAFINLSSSLNDCSPVKGKRH